MNKTKAFIHEIYNPIFVCNINILEREYGIVKVIEIVSQLKSYIEILCSNVI